MRRPVAIGFLLLFGLGPLMAQADAAEALARSLGELVHREVIEMPERPVGVDGLAFAASGAEQPPGPQAFLGLFTLSDVGALTPRPAAPVEPATLRLPGEAHWPPTSPQVRQACLQVFRF
jgi:hypothetical protein